MNTYDWKISPHLLQKKTSCMALMLHWRAEELTSSLMVEESMSLRPKAALAPSDMSEAPATVTAMPDGSNTELYPDGVSMSAMLMKLGSPRTEQFSNQIKHLIRTFIAYFGRTLR